MKLFRMFGIGSDKIFAQDCHTAGTVTKVYRCWWLSVNTKAIRRFPGDGARYPHIITFTYTVDSIPYEGKLWIGTAYRVPDAGTAIEVYYNPDNPQSYACYAFGPGVAPVRWW